MPEKTMGKILQIAQLGNPILRQPAETVLDIDAPDVQQLLDDLLATLADVGGFGLAAPQVYVPLRAFVMTTYPSQSFPDAPEIAPTVIVNPEILARSEEMEFAWEGCLSIPGLRGRVPRPSAIRARYLTREGQVVEEEFFGVPARVFQHEHDHLDGIVYLDRMENMKDLMTEKEFKKMLS